MNFNWFLNFWYLIKQYWYTSKITMIIKPLLYLLIAIIGFFKNSIKVLVILGIICVILDFILNTYETSKYKSVIDELESKNSDLERKNNEFENNIEVLGEIVNNHIESFLIFLSGELELDRTDRISVYHRDKVGKNFRIIARYSSHPKYNHIGRESYDGNKGFISKCWEGDSTDFIKILPETNTDEYLEEQYNVGYEKAELDKLNMNPRLYYVHNIASTNHPSIGVIIIESTQPQLKKYNSINSEEQLRKILAKNMSKFIPYLYDLLDNKQIQKRNDNEK